MQSLITGVPSPFYGTYRDQNISERTIESPPKYVALKDLFLPPGNDVKGAHINHHHYRYESSFDSLPGDRSYAGGSYLDGQNAAEECVEITERNPIARRLEYSDFDANGSFRDVTDFCFDREYSACKLSKTKPGRSVSERRWMFLMDHEFMAVQCAL
ncbi:uncharacterized protein LOC143188363 [Calliopsis andreniformis]|uniref:uncharacterized protein LOC143188363 n=1 Tax=Calliopsis andreniformis TaxID=337506 RepID=UPI003FCCF621